MNPKVRKSCETARIGFCCKLFLGGRCMTCLCFNCRFERVFPPTSRTSAEFHSIFWERFSGIFLHFLPFPFIFSDFPQGSESTSASSGFALYRLRPFGWQAHFCWLDEGNGPYLAVLGASSPWLITMVIVGKSPKDRVVVDPFQMTDIYGLYMGVTNLLSWDWSSKLEDLQLGMSRNDTSEVPGLYKKQSQSRRLPLKSAMIFQRNDDFLSKMLQRKGTSNMMSLQDETFFFPIFSRVIFWMEPYVLNSWETGVVPEF